MSAFAGLAALAGLVAASLGVPRQSTCPPISFDTSAWRDQFAPSFGFNFRAPPRYEHKVWPSRSDSTDDSEDWWPARSVSWTFQFQTAPATALLIPHDTSDYSACVEPWTGRGGLVERYRAGWMSTDLHRGETVPHSRILALAKRPHTPLPEFGHRQSART